ncbi:hypothetical protein [Deinococcus aestuarii]|uniref:phage NrS-1 polymerase family protein n=1 Tax=Deinococcus aestuarii TaxID=2774531 RepID=UPI001C0CD968|nr:hypothetical protein [Deinococcus aestuarii]
MIGTPTARGRAAARGLPPRPALTVYDGRHAPARPGLPSLAGLVAVLPTGLQARPWFPWVARPRAGGGLGKAPALPRHGELRPTDARRGGLPLPEALELAGRYGAAGIGVSLTPGCGLVVLDLDDLSHSARAALDGVPGYLEWSPSGGGLHLWLRGELRANRRRRGLDLLAAGYVTVTGRGLPGRPPRLGRLEQAREVLGPLWPAEVSEPSPRPIEGPSQDDDALLARLLAARNGERARALLDGDTSTYPSRSEADFALARMLRFYSQDAEQIMRILRRSGLARDKFDQGEYLRCTVERALHLGGPVWRPGGSWDTGGGAASSAGACASRPARTTVPGGGV